MRRTTIRPGFVAARAVPASATAARSTAGRSGAATASATARRRRGWMRVRFLRDTGVLLSGVGDALEVADGRWLVGAPPLGVVAPGGEVGPGDTAGVQEREPGRSEDFELVGSCHAAAGPFAVDADRWRLGRCDAEFGPGFEDREAGAPAARVVVGAGLADRVDRAVPSEAGGTGFSVGGGVPLPAFDEVGAGAVHVGRSGPVGVEHLGAGQGHGAGEAAVEHGLGAGEHVTCDAVGVGAEDAG